MSEPRKDGWAFFHHQYPRVQDAANPDYCIHRQRLTDHCFGCAWGHGGEAQLYAVARPTKARQEGDGA